MLAPPILATGDDDGSQLTAFQPAVNQITTPFLFAVYDAVEAQALTNLLAIEKVVLCGRKFQMALLKVHQYGTGCSSFRKDQDHPYRRLDPTVKEKEGIFLESVPFRNRNAISSPK